AGAGQGTFRPELSIEVFSYAVIGGLATPAGALLGILGFRWIDFVLAANFSGDTASILRLSLSGFGLLLVLYLPPGGRRQAVQRVRDAVVRRLVPAAYRMDDDPGGPDEPTDEVAAIGAALQDARTPVGAGEVR